MRCPLLRFQASATAFLRAFSHALLPLALVSWLSDFAVAATPPGPSPIAVLHGELSVKASELTFSRAMARNLRRWLEDAGLDPVAFSDARAAEALAPPRTVAHLVNIDQPPPPVLAAIDAFLARGGKVVVYNSASQKLADRLGITVGRYRAVPSFGAWSQFRFTEPPPMHAPPVVRQASASLREVSPASPQTRVAAWWEDRQGRRTPYAAWLRHPNGFWMSHVLLEDEDGESRRRLLSAITGACSPAAWRLTSDALLSRLGATVGAEDFPAALRKLRSLSRPERAGEMEALLGEAETLHARVVAERRQGLHAAATSSLWELRKLLVEAHASVQKHWPGSVRAVWDHEGFGLFLGDWEATCEALARNGVTDLFLLVATPTYAHAGIPGLAPSALQRAHGDQLAAALKAAKPRGLRVHAWISVFNPMGVSRADLADLEKAGRLLVHRDGRTLPWLDPRIPENRWRLVRTVRHLASAYPVDGVHLDYVRYPDLASGLGGGTRAAFEKATGKPVGEWPRDVLYPARPRYREYSAFRSRQVSSLVTVARQELRAAAPRALLSAAVYGRYPLCVDSVGQDWGAWLRSGTLDWAVPMNYADTAKTYKGYLDDQSAFEPALRRRILSGIGVTAAESSLNAVQVLEQIGAARAVGFGGYALFDVDATLRLEILPFLRLGVNHP